MGRTGAAALALFFVCSSTIGLQDVRSRLAGQPGVAERARISILGGPVHLLKASTFAWPSRSALLAPSEITVPPLAALAVDINRASKADRLALTPVAPLDADPLAVSGVATPASLAGAGTGTIASATPLLTTDAGIGTQAAGFFGTGTDPLEEEDDAELAAAQTDGLYAIAAGDPTGDPAQLEPEGASLDGDDTEIRVPGNGALAAALDGTQAGPAPTFDSDPSLPLYRQSAFIFGLDETALPPQPFMHMSALPGGDSGTTEAQKAEADSRRVTDGPSPAERLGLAGKRRERAEKCLAEAVYFESRGEPRRGQVAVAQVVMNRVFSGYYPADICRAVYQNAHRRLACQFTFACDNVRDVVTEPELWNQAKEIAADMLEGHVWDEKVGRATHYHARSVRPNWIREMRKLDRIGEHTFYRPRRWTS
ncbi:cell wall hydrolase [Ancylobacter vacuolatus]|uniref:Spore germination cell wall hydrolase CwlJ-like protein n=1 Tax=Ancylobacter vacuolatus TaxID=223389 RepID=A0ABU0DMM4_9HYPH|nr:cell wall hydrolase [Ancylobacter vacuolatus]MDQ0349558.1 spore germination cell wall hydrolase CwlJ-like protein [Ancylobacter vacuolatus]